MRRVPKLNFVWIVMLGVTPLHAFQAVLDTNLIFQISPPQINEYTGALTIEMVAKQKGEPIDLTLSDLQFFDEKSGKLHPLEIDLIHEIKPEEKDQLTILFLIDVSGSMIQENKFEGARRAVDRTIKHSKLPEDSRLYLATFHDTVSRNIFFDQQTVDSVLATLETTTRDTDLFTALLEKIRQMSSLAGKKAIILLSDGEHDIRRNPKYRPGVSKPTEAQVFHALRQLDGSFLILPVGLGEDADEAFLQKLPDSTSNALDVYSFSHTPDQLDSIFFRLISSLSGNYRIQLDNNNLPYQGDQRFLHAKWMKGNEVIATDRQGYRKGKINYPIPAVSLQSYWFQLFGVGIGILFFLFSVLSLLIPLLKRREFKRKYVTTYHRKGNVVVFDTVTNEPIEDGTLVVNKCRQLIPLHVWQGVGEKCPHFPDCLHSLGCDGGGAKEVSADFFSQKGELKKLNWLWFGSVGAFLAWIMYALYRGRFFGFDGYHSMIEAILNKMGLAQLDGAGLCLNCTEVANESYVGLCVGVGLALGLAIPNEMSQIRPFSVFQLLIKSVLGALAGSVSFFLGSVLHPDLISSGFVAGLMSWTLFGLLLGLILTLRSPISIKRALIAAPLASILSFFIYYFTFNRWWENTEPIRMISLIILGAVIGFVILSVVSNLEDFELEFMAPDQYRGHSVPISKWLQQGLPVSVGISPKNQVFIKWHDEAVLDKHAVFSLSDSKVFIEPVGEVLINGRMINNNKKTVLSNDDTIQLGRHSRTQLKYKERRSTDGDLPAMEPSETYKSKHYK